MSDKLNGDALKHLPANIRVIPLLKEQFFDSTDPLSESCRELKPTGEHINEDGSKSFNYTGKVVFHGDGGEKVSHVNVSLVQDRDGKFTAYKSEPFKVEYLDMDGNKAYPTKDNPQAAKKLSVLGNIEKIDGKGLDNKIAEQQKLDEELSKSSGVVLVKPQISLERAQEIEAESRGR